MQNIIEKIRNIIQERVLEHTFDCDCLCCRKDGKLDFAISEIKSLIKEKLPTKQNPEQEFRRNVNYKLHPTEKECEMRFNFQVRCQGYNSALTEIKQILEIL